MNHEILQRTSNDLPAETPGVLVSVSRPAPGLTVEHFLSAARGRARFYWEDRQGNMALAGFGICAELSAWGAGRFVTIERKAAALFQSAFIAEENQPWAGPRLFGGFAFTDDFVPDNTWSVYAPAYFILPHYQFSQYGGAAWLTVNATLQPGEHDQDVLADLRAALDARYEQLVHQYYGQPEIGRGIPTAVNYPMPQAVWHQKVAEAAARIQAGEMAKVVLARACEIRFAQRVNVDSALDYLDRRYTDCYRFLFEPLPYHAFYGATPELLVKVDGRNIATMGLAGSIRRGSTPAEDECLAAQLLDDPKERLEHRLVVDAIREKLVPLTDTLDIPSEPRILRLGNIQHLHTPITGRLKRASGVLPLVATLHPTPALGGFPRERAVDFIRQAEPVPRGWYAAPVGWLDATLDGAFGVAIRSAVSEEQRVWLYAGAGIVGSSEPQKEWDETALKFRPMLNALGIE